jgi:hypothetical protein
MLKVLKQDSETFKKLESLNEFLSKNDIEIYITRYQGIIFKTGKQYFKFSSEGDTCEALPPFYDGRYILCDANGNTDFYQED